MITSTSHNKNNNDTVPIIITFEKAYLLWHSYLPQIPKIVRYSLAKKIDDLFTDCIELSLLASYLPKDNKPTIIVRLNAKHETLKFFVKLLWEIKAIDTNKFTSLANLLSEIGKMIGGWMKYTK